MIHQAVATSATVLAALACMLVLTSPSWAQSKCSDFISLCTKLGATKGANDKVLRAKCITAAIDCKRTGCFVGPNSGTTFACNLEKR